MTRKHYTPKSRYTAQKHMLMDMSDLVVDIACAERDNLPDYAQHCRDELVRLQQEFRTLYGTEPVLLPYALRNG